MESLLKLFLGAYDQKLDSFKEIFEVIEKATEDTTVLQSKFF